MNPTPHDSPRCTKFTSCDSAPVAYRVDWKHGTDQEAAWCWAGPDHDHVHIAHACDRHFAAEIEDLMSLGLVPVATVAVERRATDNEQGETNVSDTTWTVSENGDTAVGLPVPVIYAGDEFAVVNPMWSDLEGVRVSVDFEVRNDLGITSLDDMSAGQAIALGEVLAGMSGLVAPR